MSAKNLSESIIQSINLYSAEILKVIIIIRLDLRSASVQHYRNM